MLVFLAVGIGSLAISLTAMAVAYCRAGREPTVVAALATCLVILYTLFVIVRVNRGWVRLPAEAYARQLLAACDVLRIRETRARKPGTAT